MAHVRTQCRDAIVTAVRTTSTAGAHVMVSDPPVYDVARVSLPAIAVAMSNETRKPISMPAPRMFEVESDFLVTIYAEDNADVEAVIDVISAEIEVVLAMPAVVGPWKQLTQIASGIELQAAEKARGRRALRYRATYLVRENAPQTAL